MKYNKTRFKPPIYKIFTTIFCSIFFLLSIITVIAGISSAIKSLLTGDDLIQVIITLINSSIISVAIFELATVIFHEYGDIKGSDIVVMLKRTLPRFIGTVCVALSLEGLILVIKYSKLEQAGNLYYPVAIIMSAAVLLIALGFFLKSSATIKD